MPAPPSASSPRDRVFAEPLAKGIPFAFGAEVAGVFDDMANRSIPLYSATQARTVSLLMAHVPAGGQVVDLGCSTGTLFHELLATPASAAQTWELVGVDASAPMLEQARAKVGAAATWVHTRVEELDWPTLRPAAIVANWTLQFVPAEHREAALAAMRAAAVTGCILVLSEKLQPVEWAAEWVRRDYYESKRSSGYSELEIAQKEQALQGILLPWTLEQWQYALRETGWGEAILLSSWAPFATLVCRAGSDEC
jgi:tRNA (cmo5U34)-methyltransferase